MRVLPNVDNERAEEPTAAAAAAEDVEDETATLSHEGHIVRVVGGFACM